MTRKEYKEATRRVVVTMVLAVMFIVGVTAMLTHDAYKRGILYTMEGTVVGINYEERTTTFIDTNGEEWRFKGIGDWSFADRIVLTVNNNFTPLNEYDDKVINARKK